MTVDAKQLAKLIATGARLYFADEIAAKLNDFVNSIAEGAAKHAPYDNANYTHTDSETGAFADALCKELAREYEALSQAERDAYENGAPNDDND